MSTVLIFIISLLYIIADEPSSPPTLQSNKMKYSAGDLINVSCITRESYPAVNISWFLNNQTVFFLTPPLNDSSNLNLCTPRLERTNSVDNRLKITNREQRVNRTKYINNIIYLYEK